ncbi:MAG: glycine cleavage system aminomethyltransferase GcvT [Bacteroidetes bacterium]|nr:glycine cleavage system aminomethyltransferase GcvT [Bacteroidota bacterium]MBU1117113.1 glycine cleavage system aminomethyltransferase GcvT [Bacteroidota bacterium]MBU1798644.1 glycine cleavage system aminomethyltransferase GcvT [Bacteroidota bacterium]
MKKTNFYSKHVELGAKLVEFAGYQMPVQYSSIIDEHKAVRNSVGIFDISHMGEVLIKGENAFDFVQYITVNDAAKLSIGRVQYTAMCYEDGGIVDDLLLYMIDENEYMLVINASNIEKDLEWMHKNNKFGAEIINESDEYSLIAVQGPKSKKTLQKICNHALDLEYYHFNISNCGNTKVIVSRTGYTGELGYEIYFKGSEEEALKIWDAIFEAGAKYKIQPIGLGARDTLRLEMGFCLYGNDIDETTNPIEAGLDWITKVNKGDFIGREAILAIKTNGVKRKLVAISAEGKIIPRHGYQIFNNGNLIGQVTSGTMSPILEKPIAMGYVENKFSNLDSDVNIQIRNKVLAGKTVALPFISR